MMQKPAIRLNPALDPLLIKTVFEARGRVHIPAILEVDAARWIYECLSERTPWQAAVNSGDKHMDLDVAALKSLAAEDRERLLASIHRGPRGGFQYFFHNFPMHDLFTAGRYLDHPLHAVYRLLNSAEFLEFARLATGLNAVRKLDAQATCYEPGHFLTAHDDHAEGKERLAAYVLNLTPTWRADWGGVLQFIDDDGHIAEGFTPAFNALNLLRVPQKHSVSYVTPAAEGARYSITGWLRR